MVKMAAHMGKKYVRGEVKPLEKNSLYLIKLSRWRLINTVLNALFATTITSDKLYSRAFLFSSHPFPLSYNVFKLYFNIIKHFEINK